MSVCSKWKEGITFAQRRESLNDLLVQNAMILVIHLLIEPGELGLSQSSFHLPNGSSGADFP